MADHIKKVRTVTDGFGNHWHCGKGLSERWCCMEVVRPGKTQCVCDGGIESLIEHHYEQGREDGYDAVADDDRWRDRD